jgi:uncharacterized membrane protein HdeD (DUF308 family)
MQATLSRNWWAFILRGAIALVFALMIFAWSSATPATLGRVFAVFAIAEGALAIGGTLGARSNKDRVYPLLFEGAIGIGFGLMALIAPFHSLRTVAWVIASWIAIVGLLEGATAMKLKNHVSAPRVLSGVAVISILAASAMMFSPPMGEIITVYLLGAWAAFLGAATLMVGLVLRRDVHGVVLERTTLPSLVPARPSRASSSGSRGRPR